jgi:small subunit ribosomal protein S18
MPQRRDKKGPSAKDRRPIKKKTSILNSENIAWIDYKDVNLLRRFMSERAKIRARRVTGNDQQQQAAVAKAIKLAREMALLPYSVRQVTQRSKGRRDRGDRGDRGELRMPNATPSDGAEEPRENGAEVVEQVEGLETPETNGEVEATVAADGGDE